MQLTSYLFNPVIQARFNKPNTVRNTVTWNKPLKIYKGADNFIDIVVNDFDQQPLTVNVYTFAFRARDRNLDIVINKPLTFRQGFTNRLALDLSESDLTDVDLGTYMWAIAMRDENGKERPLYLEVNGDAESSMQIVKWFMV